MFKPRNARITLLAAVLVLASGSTMAQNVTLEFTNADMDPVQLLNGTSVGIDGNGNLTAQCVLDGTTCAGVAAPGGPVPVVGLVRTNGTADINTGGTLALQWTATNNAEVCIATSSPTVNGWNGTLVTATGGTANLTMATADTFSLRLKCYNAFGASAQVSISAKVVGTDPNPGAVPACNVAGIPDGNVFVQPTGFAGHMKTWPQLMEGAPFPRGNSYLSPTGSYTLRSGGNQGLSMAAKYISVEFIPAADTTYNLYWLGIQRQLVVPGYKNARPAEAALFTISPCAGDLRAPNTFSSDPFLSKCRAYRAESTLAFGTKSSATCKLNAGQKYYLNIAMVNPLGESLSTTETSCDSGTFCEVNLNAPQ